MNINKYFKNSSDTMLSIQKQIDSIKEIAKNIYKSQKKGGKLLIAGNGGSSADADHFAGEMTCTYSNPKRRPFNAISLSSNSAAVTAWANDFGFDSYYERQLDAYAKKGDVLFLLSTGGGNIKKGYSMNLVKAAKMAIKKKIKLYSLVGKTGGELHKISNISVKIDSFATSHIQEAHIAIIHYICELLDKYEKK